MNKKQKQQAILGGSITLSIVLGLGAGVGIGAAVWKTANANGGVQEVTFFSNQDYYLDKGFNEGTYTGVSKYGKNNDMSIGIQTSDAYYDFGQGDQYAETLIKIFDNAEYVVSAGGNVGEIVPGAMYGMVDDEYVALESTKAQLAFEEAVIKDTEESMILLDDMGNVLANTENERFASVSYASEDAGFAAGIAASVYSTSVYITEKSTTNSVGIWGGVNAPTIAFLSGFEQGVNYFNFVAFGVTPGEEDEDSVKITPDGIQFIDYSKEMVINTSDQPASKYISSWYSGSFELDTTQGAGEIAQMKAMTMVKNDVNVMFPVAGGQTIIALDQISDGSQTKIIGVDTPAEDTQSGSSKDKILGSSVKELSDSAELALWYERDFKPTFDEQYEDRADINNLSYKDVKYFVETYMPSSPYKNDLGAYKFAAAEILNDKYISLEDIDAGEPTTTNEEVIQGGWNTTQTDVKDGGKGTSFYGTYSNGGIGFTTNGDELNNAYDTITTYEGDIILNELPAVPTFSAFLELALAAQVPDGEEEVQISAYSITFGGYFDDDGKPLDDNNLTNKDWIVTYG